MTRPINCRGARAVGRIVRFAFRMQGRITTHWLISCAKRVQCSSRNIPSGSAPFEIWLNVPVGTLIAFSVPIGTLCRVFQSEHNAKMFQPEHNVKLFQSEHCDKCSSWNTCGSC